MMAARDIDPMLLYCRANVADAGLLRGEAWLMVALWRYDIPR